MPRGKRKEAEKLREKVRPTPKKTKFGRKAREDDKSIEEMDLKTILIGIFHISLKCSTISLILPCFLKSKRMEEILVEVEKSSRGKT